MRVTGGGLSPDGTQVVLIVTSRDDPNGHLLVVADIAPDGSAGPLAILATGQEFAPNDGDQTIKPAGLGWSAEIVWTPTALIYSLGPNEGIHDTWMSDGADYMSRTRTYSNRAKIRRSVA